nr:response regulator [Methylomarinum sp. Ch1-1]MDP4521831.1 response regulator [Methylomarinum sp. Ch1-1]
MKILIAHTPKLGIELALAHRPDLILLDIHMPGMNGYEVLKILQSDPAIKNTPVVAVTANAMKKEIEQAIAAGFTAYVSKPIQIQAFLGTIDKLLNND